MGMGMVWVVVGGNVGWGVVGMGVSGSVDVCELCMCVCVCVIPAKAHLLKHLVCECV